MQKIPYSERSLYLSSPVLQQLNLDNPFIAKVEASDPGMGAMLSQRESIV